MNKPDKPIVKFILKHHILHLATSFHDVPYCATCFYLYLEEQNIFVFASNEETRHIKEALLQKQVAFTIALDTKTIAKIRGVQVLGTITEIDDVYLRKKYTDRFPMAMFIPFKLWAIAPHTIKMTDNTLGFGKKIIWEKESL